MDDLKISIHPLFFIFGLYFALIGKVFSFLIFTFTALIHELGHFFASQKLGYRLNRIVLMPYGAIISGNNLDLKYKDECKIALAGPLINLLIGTIFVALWWFYPATYPYTDTIVIANFSLALVNLLPAFPLDGGRFLKCTLCLFCNQKTASRISRSLGIVASFIVFALFIYSIFTKINFTILFFSVFMFIGSVSKNPKNNYIKIFNNYQSLKVTKPIKIQQVAISGDLPLKSIYPLLDNNYYLVLNVIVNDVIAYEISGENLQNMLTNNSPYAIIKDAIYH